MMAISIYQPWASLIAMGWKKIETRHWYVRHRGALCIYATKKFTPDDRASFYEHPIIEIMSEAGIKRFEQLPFGKLVGLATVTDCLTIRNEDKIIIPPHWEGVVGGDDFYHSPEYAFGDFSQGRTMTYLRDATRFDPPVPVRPPGRDAIWQVTGAAEVAVKELLRSGFIAGAKEEGLFK